MNCGYRTIAPTRPETQSETENRCRAQFNLPDIEFDFWIFFSHEPRQSKDGPDDKQSPISTPLSRKSGDSDLFRVAFRPRQSALSQSLFAYKLD
jgi:hypothetical protein